MTGLSKVLLVMGASLAAGAALGVLFAPDKGSETRKKIAKRSKKLAGRVKDELGNGLESLEEMKGVLQQQLTRINKKLENTPV